MEVLFTRPVVIALALLGAALATAASVLQMRGLLGERGARALNIAGYTAMGASMLLFIVAGFRS